MCLGFLFERLADWLPTFVLVCVLWLWFFCNIGVHSRWCRKNCKLSHVSTTFAWTGPSTHSSAEWPKSQFVCSHVNKYVSYFSNKPTTFLVVSGFTKIALLRNYLGLSFILTIGYCFCKWCSCPPPPSPKKGRPTHHPSPRWNFHCSREGVCLHCYATKSEREVVNMFVQQWKTE